MRPVKKKKPAFLKDALLLGEQPEWQLIKNALVESMGPYCAYCEMPLSSYEIEHLRYSAAWQPEINEHNWENLLLICGDCRSGKSILACGDRRVHEQAMKLLAGS